MLFEPHDFVKERTAKWVGIGVRVFIRHDHIPLQARAALAQCTASLTVLMAVV
jgi:hypothetical protein